MKNEIRCGHNYVQKTVMLCYVVVVYSRTKRERERLSQTPSTGSHLSFNHCLFSYAIGSRKLSANEQFFVGAQTVVSLLRTTQI